MRPITLLRAHMSPVIDCLLFAAGIDKAVSKFISKKINSLTSLWNGLLSSSKKIEMAIWIKIVIQLGKLHHLNPGVSLNREIKQLIHNFLSGSLVQNEQLVAMKILDHIWGDESTLLMKRDSTASGLSGKGAQTKPTPGAGASQVSEEIVAKHFSDLKLTQIQIQVKKVQNLLYNLREGFSTILCAPTMTGKSILLKIALLVENECRKEESQVEMRKFFPKSCDLEDLFGYFDENKDQVRVYARFNLQFAIKYLFERLSNLNFCL